MNTFLTNMLVNITPKFPNHKKIATFCFFMVLCQVGSTLYHAKSWTRLLYGKVSNFEVEHIRLTSQFPIRFKTLTRSVFTIDQ